MNTSLGDAYVLLLGKLGKECFTIMPKMIRVKDELLAQLNLYIVDKDITVYIKSTKYTRLPDFELFEDVDGLKRLSSIPVTYYEPIWDTTFVCEFSDIDGKRYRMTTDDLNTCMGFITKFNAVTFDDYDSCEMI